MHAFDRQTDRRMDHRHSQGGAVGVPAPPRAVKKIFFRPNLQEKCVSAPPQDIKCTPQPEQESIFRIFCWVVKKCTPADKILATPMGRTDGRKEISSQDRVCIPCSAVKSVPVCYR